MEVLIDENGFPQITSSEIVLGIQMPIGELV